MPRQFGLKQVTAVERSASALSAQGSREVPQSVARAEPSSRTQTSPQPEPLYAPASWRGKADRRCISAD